MTLQLISILNHLLVMIMEMPRLPLTENEPHSGDAWVSSERCSWFEGMLARKGEWPFSVTIESVHVILNVYLSD